MSKEPKTAEQINTPLIGICDVCKAYNQCAKCPESSSSGVLNATMDCTKCKANIRQQLLINVANFYAGEISKEKLAELLDINFYEMDELMRL